MPSWVFAEISSVQLETKVLHFARSSRGILKPQSPGIPRRGHPAKQTGSFTLPDLGKKSGNSALQLSEALLGSLSSPRPEDLLPWREASIPEP